MTWKDLQQPIFMEANPNERKTYQTFSSWLWTLKKLVKFNNFNIYHKVHLQHKLKFLEKTKPLLFN